MDTIADFSVSSVEQYYLLGNEAYRNKNFEEALTLYNHGVKQITELFSGPTHFPLLIKLQLNSARCNFLLRNYEVSNKCIIVRYYVAVTIILNRTCFQTVQ